MEREIDQNSDTQAYDLGEMTQDAFGGIFGGVTGGKVVGNPFANLVRISEPFDLAFQTARRDYYRLMKSGSALAVQAARERMKFIYETIPEIPN